MFVGERSPRGWARDEGRLLEGGLQMGKDYGAALVPWTYFAKAVNGSADILLGNTSLISKVYFPMLICESQDLTLQTLSSLVLTPSETVEKP